VYLIAVAQESVGTIISLNGTARLKEPDGRVVLLNGKNYARSLQPNQKLRVDRNGQMQITLCDRPANLSIPSDRWYIVPPYTICSTTANSKKRDVLSSFFDIAARHRGEDDFILFPVQADETTDVIRAETAAFRWASSTKARITLSISVVGSESMKWEQSAISGEDGSYASDSLTAFLKDVRKKQPNTTLKLKIQTSLNTENSTTFQILSLENEEALKREIANVDETNRLLFHLSRAAIYLRYRLLIDGAEEYEQALKLAPESIDLLKATAALEEQTGNLKRFNELQNILETLNKSPY
jgi:hypothetical protein